MTTLRRLWPSLVLAPLALTAGCAILDGKSAAQADEAPARAVRVAIAEDASTVDGP
ncbi:hypothetical protein JW859_09895 [bacterium]|nr:hypothetical protein [bacterium]